MATAITESDSLAGDQIQPESEPLHQRSDTDVSRRRFTLSVIVGAGLMLPLFLWLQWDMWSGSLNPLRAVPYAYFYDLQARAIFHGHLYLPNGTMGIEAFVHDGHDYTYFGLFPSVIRMPILLVTSRFDGEMTAPSILLAWTLTGVSSALMFWRVRILMRGDAVVGRAEAAAYGAIMATIMGGSVVLYLAATPFVFSEDFAWSVPLTVGSLFALLGVLERPSRGRVAAAGLLILCANLNRSPSGWACSVAALVVAAWFALGRGGRSNRRWAIPMVIVTAVPFLVSCVVTYLKFGISIGLPMADQVWATVNAHRRYFLSANGGKAFNFTFLPSTLWAYFQPAGIRVGGLFPFVTPPAAPARWLAGVVLDQSYPTASFTDTSPLLLLLGCWGTIAAFRPRGIGRVRLTRIIIFGAAAGGAGVLLWGYISQRYLGDLMPFFIIAGAVGLTDIWHRLEKRSRQARRLALGTITALGLYCIAANLAIAMFPVSQWTPAQSARFISVEKSLSIDSLANTVWRGSNLPYWAPAGQVFAANNCSGLYLSSGNDEKGVPGQQLEHYTWMPVEQSPTFTHVIAFTFNRPATDLTHGVTAMTYGRSRLVLEPSSVPGFMQMHLYGSGTSISWPSPIGWQFPEIRRQVQIVVTVDPNTKRLVVDWYDDEKMLDHYVAGDGPAVVTSTKLTPGSPNPMVTVTDVPLRSSDDQYRTALSDIINSHMALCRSLTQNS